MANNTVEAQIRLTDPGATVDAGVNNMKRLNAETDKLEASNKRRTAAARKAENTDYNAARAIGGGTGAAGRDFAKESRAIGGLVAVYAQYAATVFAVEAAFRKLKDAADVENMTKAMDQMAASSGVALGSLSKQFVEATGHAISLKEGMEAVGKASSAGLSNKQILELADVAKKAAQYLGRDVNDSISRLSRGVSKLEPELLDELGIYTKLGPAVEKYAASLGKPVSALTELQRVQAFTTAVLKEGQEKYKDINLDTNPYDKLLASLNDLLQKGLNFINFFVKPIASLLSESPVALAGAVALLASSILGKFLPAFGELRKSARETANNLAVVAKEKATESGAALSAAKLQAAETLKVKKAALQDERIAAVDAAQKQIEAVDKTQITKRAQKIISNPDLEKITGKQLEYLQDQASKKVGATKLAYEGFISAVQKAKQAHVDYFESVHQAEINASKTAGGRFDFTAAGMNAKAAEAARQRASGANIIATAAETASIKGFRAAFGEMIEGIRTEKLGVIRGTMTGIGATATAAAARLAQFAGVVGALVAAIGVMIGIKQALDLFFNTATARTEELNKKLENLADLGRVASDVLNKFGSDITAQSLAAKTKSIQNISDALEDIPKQLENQQKDMSRWEKFWDFVLPEKFGGDIEQRTTRAFAANIMNAIDNMATPEMQENAKKKLGDILNISGVVDKNAVADALESGTTATRQAAADLVSGVKKEMEGLNNPVQKVKDSVKSLDKAYLDMKNSFINNDPGTKFGLALLDTLDAMNTAFNNPITKLATLRDLSKDISKISLFPDEAQADLRSAATQIGDLEKQLKAAQDRKDKAEQELKNTSGSGAAGAAALAQRQQTNLSTRTETGTYDNQAARTDVDAARRVGEAAAELGRIRGQMAQVVSGLQVNLASGVERAIKYIEGPLVRAIAQSNIETRRSLVGILPKTEKTVDLQYKLEIESIKIRREEILALKTLADSVNLKRIQEEQKTIDEKLANPNLDAMEKRPLLAQRADLERQTKAIKGQYTLSDAKKEGIIPTGGLAEIIAQQVGIQAKLAGLTGEGERADIARGQGTISAKFERERENLTMMLDQRAAEFKQEIASDAFKTLSKAEQERRTQENTANEQGIKELIAQIPLRESAAKSQYVADYAGDRQGRKGMGDLSKEGVEAVKRAEEQLDVLKQNQKLEAEGARLAGERKVSALEYGSAINIANVELDTEYNTSKRLLQNQSNGIEYLKQDLEYSRSISAVGQQQYNDKIKDITITEAQIDRAKARLEVFKSSTTEIQNMIREQMDAGSIESEESQAQLKNTINNRDAQLTALDDEFNKRKNLAVTVRTNQEEMAQRQQAYNDVFLKGIDSMSDALATFARTGKLDFKGLVDSMIQDLIRYELRQQMLKMWEGPNGLQGTIGTGAATAGSWLMSGAKSLFGFAQGGAWDNGVMKYAKGDMFTNSIVTQPTLFKFAHGTGLMGEAGPEAIMPLKRDSNGSLGVSGTGGTGGKVDVVVNNYSGEKATTKESTDSKGNRKIEVVVGDLVADQIGKTGSSAQQAMTANFGQRPALVRR